jgi:hypothetical protein
MPLLAIGLLALLFGVYALRQLGRAPPAQVAASIRGGGGLIALAVAAFLLLRGQVMLALGAGGAALYLFTGESFSFQKLADFLNQRQKARRQSQARTAILAMTLDHVTGAVDGDVLDGPFQGRKLSALSRAECDQLHRDCRARDPDSAVLLEAYFDRRFTGWRTAGEDDSDPGRRAGQGGAGGRSRVGEMSEQEAYETLGLRPGAPADEIVRAHRRLMKERHPDHGGTTDDAARINQAKDRLLRRHG